MIKVLLVEDEPTLACIIRDTLSEQGFSVRMACDGEEALPLIDTSCPDVIVADVMMPRMDGFEMLKRMRRNGNQTPVLLLTARSAVSDVVEGFELGANDYLRKPFSMQELIVRIKALAGRAHVAADKTAVPCSRSDIPRATPNAKSNGRFAKIMLPVCARTRITEFRNVPSPNMPSRL